MRTTREKLLLLDFDGTICLGDDPVLAYAEQVDALLTEQGLSGPGGASVHSLVKSAFDAGNLLIDAIEYTADGTPTAVIDAPQHAVGGAHPISWPLQDGYQLTQLLARQSGLSDEDTSRAFMQGRRTLLARGLETSDVHSPHRARELFLELRARVGVVLITNSPAEGFETWLQALGLTDVFDTIIHSAGKPSGMPAAIAQAQTALEAPVAEEAILSVGDIWANDLSHVAATGGSTILIDRYGTGLGEPQHRVESWHEVDGLIRGWAEPNGAAASPTAGERQN